MDSWRRRRRLFDEFFSQDFFSDDIFRQMEENMARIFNEIMKPMDEPRSIVYGFTLKNGSDGRPQIEEFGNIPRKGASFMGEREPLVDVIEGDDEIKVIAELPGVDKKDIDLDADANQLTIDVDNKDRKYHKEVSLPAEVEYDNVKAAYKNGILEVTMKRAQKRKTKKKIIVE